MNLIPQSAKVSRFETVCTYLRPPLALECVSKQGAETKLRCVCELATILVIDNLSAHKGEKVSELIEDQGSEPLYCPLFA